MMSYSGFIDLSVLRRDPLVVYSVTIITYYKVDLQFIHNHDSSGL